MGQLSDEDAHLDEQWRLVFGQPLPMLGAPDIARQILNEHIARQEAEPAKRGTPSDAHSEAGGAQRKRA